MLLLAFLVSSFPLATIASGRMCALACCAGRAPHAAGSCMNGSCHAFRMGRLKTTLLHHQLPVQQYERLCGMPRGTARARATLLRESVTLSYPVSSEQSPSSRGPEAARLSATGLGRPCQLDCGAGTFCSSSQGRPRDASAISFADKPRPPSLARLDHSSLNLAKALDTLCRRSRPRGPPISFS